MDPYVLVTGVCIGSLGILGLQWAQRTVKAHMCWYKSLPAKVVVQSVAAPVAAPAPVQAAPVTVVVQQPPTPLAVPEVATPDITVLQPTAGEQVIQQLSGRPDNLDTTV